MSLVALEDFLFSGIATGLISVDHGQDLGWQGTWPMNCRFRVRRAATVGQLCHISVICTAYACRLLN